MNLVEKGLAFEEKHKGGVIWSLVLMGSTGLSALFMFLIHVVAVRLLETEQYGEFASAIALVGIVGVAASSVQAATVQRVKKKPTEQRFVFSQSIEITFLAAFSLLLGLIALFLIGVSLNTACLLALWVPAAVMIARANGEIQGREIQTVLHGATAVIAGATLLLSAIVLILWTDVESLLIARLVVTIGFASYLLRATSTPVKTSLRFIDTRLIHSTVLVSSMWFAANMDVLLSRSALGKTDNGEIAIAAMLVNSVLLVPGLIAAVVYPRAIELRASKQSEKKLLGGAILLSGSVQTVMAILLTLLASPLVNWLAGPSHHVAIEVVRPLSIAYIPLGIAIVVSQFTLALGTLRQSLTFMSITLGFAIILINVQTTALRFVEVLVGLSVILSVILILMALYSIRKIGDEASQN
jgi:O-antigen/teichoic acid export membrane protein